MSREYPSPLSGITTALVLRPLSLALCAAFGHEAIGPSSYYRGEEALIEWRCWRCDKVCERESEGERDQRVAAHRESLERFSEFVRVGS